jgi:hypothetical protein
MVLLLAGSAGPFSGCHHDNPALDRMQQRNAVFEALAAQPDAPLNAERFDRAKDVQAAEECHAAYAMVKRFGDMGSTPKDYEQYLIEGTRGATRTKRLYDDGSGHDDNLKYQTAWLLRHHINGNYVLTGREPDTKAYLNISKDYASKCDKALTAWGAPPMTDSEVRRNFSPYEASNLKKKLEQASQAN